MLAASLRHVRANAVGYLALFIALGGTSYAAVPLPRNSVGTAQIKKSAVTSAKVKNGSLAAADLSKAARKSLRGKAGPKGPAGAKGDPGLSNGVAGGDLVGTYPNPAIAAGAVTTSKLAGVPHVSLGLSASQSVADDTSTPLSLDLENEDSFGMHDPATPSQFTAPVAGLYLVSARTTWFLNGIGWRMVTVQDPNNSNDPGHSRSRNTAGRCGVLPGQGRNRAIGRRGEARGRGPSDLPAPP